jgi:hypothetical protein
VASEEISPTGIDLRENLASAEITYFTLRLGLYESPEKIINEFWLRLRRFRDIQRFIVDGLSTRLQVKESLQKAACDYYIFKYEEETSRLSKVNAYLDYLEVLLEAKTISKQLHQT